MKTQRTALLFVLTSMIARAGMYIYSRLSVFGAFRHPTTSASSFALDGEIFTLPGLKQCEDLHHIQALGKVYTACQGDETVRFGWFPSVGNFDKPELVERSDGGIYVIDVETWKSERLTITDFDGPYFTHGLGIHYVPSIPNEMWIHAVNHIPSQSCFPPSGSPSHPDCISESRVEIFLHDPTESPGTARHIKTVRHPLIFTPNDIHSLGPDSFLVTNDHAFRTSHLGRSLEDLFDLSWMGRTSVIMVDGDRVETAIPRVHGANGLGAGPNGEILLGDAGGGAFQIVRRSGDAFTIREHIQLETTIDNPTYFSDPYATPGIGGDKSMYVAGGLTRALDHQANIRNPAARDPVSVWSARRNASASGGWDKKLLMEDTGEWATFASTALVVGIDPKKSGNGGSARREGWLMVTGPYSKAVGVLKVEL